MRFRRKTNLRHLMRVAGMISGLAVGLGGFAYGSPDGGAVSPQSSETGRAVGNNPEPRRYTGPGSCSSISCHGSLKPRTETRIGQNEYSIWAMQDKHAQAFTVLSNPVALRMARLLGLGAPDQEAKCLACHALTAPPEERGRTLDLSDGVSCEVCHGPASAWLGEHTTRGWTHERSVALGMYDTRDLVKRTELCLNCHLGDKDRVVDHEMVAAGHPDLYFELSSFSAALPRHWKTPPESAPAWEAGEWAVGQAAQLRRDLDRLAALAQAGTWPEYSQFDCFACHHSLTDAAHSWRQERGYAGRRPGNPPWDESRYVVFRVFLQEVDRAAAQRLDEPITQLAAEMNRLTPDRKLVASLCAASHRALEEAIPQLKGENYDDRLALRLLHAVAEEGDSLANAGERSAEQAAMALDTFYLAYSLRHPSADPEVQSAISGLFPLLEDPAAYDQSKFAQQMRKVKAALH